MEKRTKNKHRLLIWAVLFLFMVGCGKTSSAAPVPEESTPKPTLAPITRPEDGYHSEVSEEDCYLCRYTDEDAPWKPEGWLQDNIGIISLNTFDVVPIRIIRYEMTGEQIKGPSGFMKMAFPSSETEGGFSATVMEEPDGGYADFDLEPGNDLTLDIDKLASFLCKECLNEVVTMSLERTYGVGLIDLATGEIHPFERNVVGFSLGNYLIRCEYEEPTSDKGRFVIDTFAVYRPPMFVEE